MRRNFKFLEMSIDERGKMNHCFVSIIMTVYNGEKYIREAIESVLKQSCSWELFIIDDCSTDHTVEVVKPYLVDSRIRYLRNDQNSGVAKSRNRGITLAQGDYVAFLDADDRWREDKLEETENTLKLIEHWKKDLRGE